jgi:hypothetical protein
VLLLDGAALVAEARPALVEVDPPAAVALADAEAARERHVRDWSPDFAECYVCGVRDDGLEIRAGAVEGREPLHAAPMTLIESGPEFVWAAIDCPGAYAVGAEGRGDIVLGRMTALGEDGRKLHAGTALFSAGGELLAIARQTWIAPKPS